MATPAGSQWLQHRLPPSLRAAQFPVEGASTTQQGRQQQSTQRGRQGTPESVSKDEVH